MAVHHHGAGDRDRFAPVSDEIDVFRRFPQARLSEIEILRLKLVFYRHSIVQESRFHLVHLSRVGGREQVLVVSVGIYVSTVVVTRGEIVFRPRSGERRIHERSVRRAVVSGVEREIVVSQRWNVHGRSVVVRSWGYRIEKLVDVLRLGLRLQRRSAGHSVSRYQSVYSLVAEVQDGIFNALYGPVAESPVLGIYRTGGSSGNAYGIYLLVLERERDVAHVLYGVDPS